MNKNNIDATTAVRHIITGFVSYTIITGFICFVILIVVNNFLNNFVGISSRGLYITPVSYTHLTLPTN